MFQLIPQISSLSWFTTIVPLALVLSITAVKDATDDYVSHDFMNHTHFHKTITRLIIYTRHLFKCSAQSPCPCKITVHIFIHCSFATRATTRWTIVSLRSSSEARKSLQVWTYMCCSFSDLLWFRIDLKPQFHTICCYELLLQAAERKVDECSSGWYH